MMDQLYITETLQMGKHDRLIKFISW